ncbi:MAG: AMP-binding protein, partial [Myxococcota bacterium]
MDGRDPALMIYTSGTTAKSKGVVLSYEAIVANMEALTSLWGWSAADELVLALPLFHVHGLCIGVYGSILHGMPMRLLPAFDPTEVVEGIEAGGTIFMGVPTMYRRLVEHLERSPDAAAACRRARLFTSGSAPLSPDLFNRFEACTAHQIVERYGMSETLITLSNRIDVSRQPGVVGRPVPGVEVRIVDDCGELVSDGELGELEVKGAGLLTEYWGRPDETEKAFRDGWFRTGDVVVRDDEGMYRIAGRKSVDIIKSGGFKISAREIEDVIRDHSAVVDVAVVGLADEEWGQSIAAAVVRAEPASTPSACSDESASASSACADEALVRDLIAWVTARL